MSTQKIEIRGGRVVDPASQFDDVASVFIADGKIAGIGQTPAGFKADEVIDAKGLVVAPGLVDLSARIAGNIDAELEAAVSAIVFGVVVEGKGVIQAQRPDAEFRIAGPQCAREATGPLLAAVCDRRKAVDHIVVRVQPQAG